MRKIYVLLFTKNKSVYNLKSTLLFLCICFISSNVFGQLRTWKGLGSATPNSGATSNFNYDGNWSPSTAPTATDDVVIDFDDNNLTSTIDLTLDASIKNLTITVRGNHQSGTLNVGSNTLTVNGVASADISSSNPNTSLSIGVTSPSLAGTIDFKSHATFGLSSKGFVYIIGNVNSKIIFRGNLNLGLAAATVANFEPGTVVFDGIGNQNYMHDNTTACNFNYLIIGNQNSPTVILGGSSTVDDNILGDLTVNNFSILDLNTNQLNRKTNGGSFLLNDASQIKLSASGSVAVGGSATLIAGSNFPSGFNIVTLSPTSTVEFYGSAQIIPLPTFATTYGNLTLSGSSNKTAPTSVLEIKGNLTGAGTAVFVHNNGTVLMNGTSGQTYNSSTEFLFYNLTNNSRLIGGGFSINNNLSVLKELKLNTLSSLKLNIGDLKLRSSDTLTANVASVPNELNIIQYVGIGRFIVERYLFQKKSWRLLATPVEIASSPTITESWREGGLTTVGYGTQITGPSATYVGMDENTQRGSMKWFDPFTQNYKEITNTASIIARNEGYYLFVRGDRTQNSSGTGNATTLKIKGKINIGTQPNYNVPSNKFASVGNPYASAIDFKSVTKSVNIIDAFTVWNPLSTFQVYGVGGFETYIYNPGLGHYQRTPGNIIRDSIQSGEAIFIQSNTGGGFITIKENDKVGGSRVVSRLTVQSRVDIIIPTLNINLETLNSNKDFVIADGIKIDFDNIYSNEIENTDVRKIFNTNDNLSIKKDNLSLIVERHSPLKITDSIFLKLTNTRVAFYKFEINPSLLENLPLKSFLKDKFLHTETPLSLSEVTNFNFEITNDPNSRVEDRFMIVFKKFLPVRFTAITAVRKTDKSINLTWNTENENNIDNYKVEKSIDGVNFTEIGSQMPTANNFGNPYYTFYDAKASKEIIYYRIKGNGITGNSIYSNTAKVLALAENNNKQVNIFPNPVTNGNININFDGAVFGNYVITINDFTGQLIKSETFRHQVTGESCIIKISNAGGGFYTANIVDETGIKKMIPFLIK